jgi:hypothetical protein
MVTDSISEWLCIFFSSEGSQQFFIDTYAFSSRIFVGKIEFSIGGVNMYRDLDVPFCSILRRGVYGSLEIL